METGTTFWVEHFREGITSHNHQHTRDAFIGIVYKIFRIIHNDKVITIADILQAFIRVCRELDGNG